MSIQTVAGRAPAQRSNSTLFPAPLIAEKSINNVFGGISQDGSHGWIVGESELFVFDLHNEGGPRRKAELAADLQEDEERVEKFLCVTEVTIRGESFLAASTRELQCGDSALLLFDLRSCKICTTIKLPYSASAILQLNRLSAEGNGEALLTQFASCLVLGTTGGHLLALDLDFVHHRQEVREMELQYPGRDYDPARFAAQYPNHIPCVALNSAYHQGGRFRYEQDRGEAILLPEKAVHITTLAYAPEFDALAVGFNFGTFQLWSLCAERLLYSSAIGEGGLATKVPVSHFLFQCDPTTAELTRRAYLWIGRSSISSPLHTPTHAAEVQLLSIKFAGAKEEPSARVGLEYKKALSALPQVARIVGIHLLAPRERSPGAEETTDEQEVGGTDWDMEAGAPAASAAGGAEATRSPWVLFTWEVQQTSADAAAAAAASGAGTQHRVHMGLFNMDAVAATGGFVRLAYPFQRERACLSMWIDPASVSDFVGLTKGLFPDERERFRAASAHTLPISFDVACLHANTHTHCAWLGDQEKALSVFGQQLLPWADPSLGLQTTYQECKSAGLLNTLPGESVSDAERDYRYQYKALFDMCLRLQLTSSICHLATLTREDGSYLFANPRIILEWAWDKYSAFSDALSDHSSPLYLSTLSVGNRREASMFAEQLRRLAGRMWSLQHVVEALLSRHDNTDKGQKNLDDKYRHVVHTLQHLKLMMWVREKIENWLFVGDSQTLADQFHERRARRKELWAETQRRLTGQAFPTKMESDEAEENGKEGGDEADAPAGDTTCLFIELLLATVRRGSSGGGGEAKQQQQMLHYPPHHLSDFLRALFASPQPESLKHAIVYYCLRDLVGWGKIKAGLLEDYVRRFHVALPYVRLVEGLWGLDRGRREDIPTAWKNLTEVSGDAAALLDEWKGRVLRLLYDLGARAQALHFLRWRQPPAETPIDAILHLQILLESDLLPQAFNYQRLHFGASSSSSSSSSGLAGPEASAVRRTLLDHIFHFFLATGRMNELFKFHLDAAEEEALVHFLTAKAKGPGLEQLIHFFLQRGRYVEAMRAYRELSSSAVPLLPPERAQFLECLVQNYRLALPSVALQPPPSLAWPSSSSSSSASTTSGAAGMGRRASSSSLSFSLMSVFPSTSSSSSTSTGVDAATEPATEQQAEDQMVRGGQKVGEDEEERISFPASPFGAPPSLHTPKRGWRSRDSNAADGVLASPTRGFLSPFRSPLSSSASSSSSSASQSPFVPAASPVATTAVSPRRPTRVFGGALVASPVRSSPRESVVNQLGSPLLRNTSSGSNGVGTPAVAEAEEEMTTATTPAASTTTTTKRRLAKRTKRGLQQTPAPAAAPAVSSSSRGPRTRSRVAND